MKCPCCNKEVGVEHFMCAVSSKGGASGTGEVKKRSREHYRRAAAVRWNKPGARAGMSEKGSGTVQDRLGEISEVQIKEELSEGSQG